LGRTFGGSNVDIELLGQASLGAGISLIDRIPRDAQGLGDLDR
jgi:hypothetical protein